MREKSSANGGGGGGKLCLRVYQHTCLHPDSSKGQIWIYSETALGKSEIWSRNNVKHVDLNLFTFFSTQN